MGNRRRGMLSEQPRKGQRVAWRNNPGEPLKHHGTVLRIEGNLCWYQPDDGEAAPFIWRFKDGLNTLAEIVP
jgi:hypothetical protein